MGGDWVYRTNTRMINIFKKTTKRRKINLYHKNSFFHTRKSRLVNGGGEYGVCSLQSMVIITVEKGSGNFCESIKFSIFSPCIIYIKKELFEENNFFKNYMVPTNEIIEKTFFDLKYRVCPRKKPLFSVLQ